MSKQARNLGAYKLARQVLAKLQTLKVPAKFQVIHNIYQSTMYVLLIIPNVVLAL